VNIFLSSIANLNFFFIFHHSLLKADQVLSLCVFIYSTIHWQWFPYCAMALFIVSAYQLSYMKQ